MVAIFFIWNVIFLDLQYISPFLRSYVYSVGSIFIYSHQLYVNIYP